MAIDEIKELIELDLGVQENLEIRHREKNALKQNLEKEKKEMSEKAWNEIYSKVAQSKQKLDDEIKANNILSKQLLETQIKDLESNYQNNFEVWVNTIVKKCIE